MTIKSNIEKCFAIIYIGATTVASVGYIGSIIVSCRNKNIEMKVLQDTNTPNIIRLDSTNPRIPKIFVQKGDHYISLDNYLKDPNTNQYQKAVEKAKIEEIAYSSSNDPNEKNKIFRRN